jgi:ADP-heptose:LPS heptosyltransferase/GT2 family glycosyltransferase
VGCRGEQILAIQSKLSEPGDWCCPVKKANTRDMAPSRRDAANPFLHHPKAAWAIFDPAFYSASNPATKPFEDHAALLEHYLSEGAAAGHSPNRWFDETFYRRSSVEVEDLIRAGEFASGFEHYCRIGYARQAPHWLFDPVFYVKRNPKLTDEALKTSGFINAYDHFLKHGAAEQRPCHQFFDPVAYARALDRDTASICEATGGFKHFLLSKWNGRQPGLAEPRVSPHFDPGAYLAAYPKVAEDISAGIWHSALHHYLANRAGGFFQPLPPAKPQLHPVSTPLAASPRIKIHVDRPAHRNGEALEPIDGHLDIIGWAAATHPVLAVDVFIDGTHCGHAHHGIRTEGVAAAFPDLTYAMYSGFRFIAPVPPRPGRHTLRIVARGDAGMEASAEFAAEFRPAVLRDGPWSLRRRMRSSEVELKVRLLKTAGSRATFVIFISDATNNVEARQRTLKSLDRQIYPNWRLHTGGSVGEGNAIDSPDCWVVPVTPGDELGVDALLELALHRLAEPEADFLYSDERRSDPSTLEIAPFFKPGWSPELLLATDYIGRLWTASPALVARAGLVDIDLAHKSNHALVLRLTESASRIGHVAHVLCESAERPADRSAVEGALMRRGICAHVDNGRAPDTWRICHELPNKPLVTVIIPTAGARGLIETTLRHLRERTFYPRLQVIVIDTAPGVEATWKVTVQGLADRVIEDAGPFNWSRVNNLAAALASGAILLFLNDDVSVPDDAGSGAWLDELVGQVQAPGVGIVGPQLLYPGGLVQHAGMFLHRGGGRNAFAGLPGTAAGPFGQALTQRNVSAVTGACLMVRRDVFDRLGGFDERFDTVCNDTDFCLRAQAAGWRVVYTPHAALTHHESVTRAGRPEAGNEALFAETWRQALQSGDAFFSRHLSREHADYRPDPEYTETIYPARPIARRGAIRRILIIKLDQIGDFLLSLPAIRHLARFFGNARITLLATPEVCRLAALEPSIGETIPFVFPAHEARMQHVVEEGREFTELGARLAAARFDLAVDLRGHPESRGILRESGATWRAGFDPGGEFPWLDIAGVMEADTAKRAKHTHMGDTLLDFAARVTACFSVVAQPRLAAAGGWPQRVPAPPEGGALRIAIHPGAGTAIKQWPAAHFAALIDGIAAARACWIVLVGAAHEAGLGGAILALAQEGAAVSAIGLTTLGELACLLAGCDLFIGNDSGPKHLAASLGVRTIGIHSGVVDAREWGPLGADSVAIRRRMACSPCYLAKPDECPRSLGCLNDLTHGSVLHIVALVVDAADTLCGPQPQW